MSIRAVSWALGCKVDRSSTKFVLVALCNYANEFGECYPSAKQLSDDTAQDIKTVEANLKRLRDLGLLFDTGMRRGATKQVIVYRINPEGLPAKLVDGETPPKTDDLNTPVFPDNTPVFPVKDPRFSRETPPKTGDGTVKEPSRNRQEDKKAQAPDFLLPDWIDKKHWDAWHSCEKRKKATPAQKQIAVDKLDKWRHEGVDFAAALENAAVAGWQGLFKPDDNKPAAMTARNSETTYQRSMRERVTEFAPDSARKAPGQAQKLPQTPVEFFEVEALRITQ